jgi:plasmid stability protein
MKVGENFKQVFAETTRNELRRRAAIEAWVFVLRYMAVFSFCLVLDVCYYSKDLTKEGNGRKILGSWLSTEGRNKTFEVAIRCGPFLAAKFRQTGLSAQKNSHLRTSRISLGD